MSTQLEMEIIFFVNASIQHNLRIEFRNKTIGWKTINRFFFNPVYLNEIQIFALNCYWFGCSIIVCCIIALHTLHVDMYAHRTRIYNLHSYLKSWNEIIVLNNWFGTCYSSYSTYATHATDTMNGPASNLMFVVTHTLSLRRHWRQYHLNRIYSVSMSFDDL